MPNRDFEENRMNETNAILRQAHEAQERGDWARVTVCADELLKRDPADDVALFLAGVAFLNCGNEGLALQFFNTARAATKEEHKLAAIWNNIGCCLQNYQPTEAYRALQECLKHGAPPASTYDNLCNVASRIGRHAEALQYADLADKTGGNDPSYNRSFALFHMGRWKEAWPEFGKALHSRDGAQREYGLPRYDFEVACPLERLIVHGEQGIGDEILFMSMLPREFTGVIECNARNETLFARSFPHARVYGTLGQREIDWVGPSRCTHKLEMGGIGEAFGVEKPFVAQRFLSPDLARMAGHAAWIAGSEQVGNLRVGIAWTGGAWKTGRARRSVPFELIQKLSLVPGVTFVNLEYEDRRDLLKGSDWLNPYWATRKGADMDDLAALISSLDLVIAPTTSVVDLAGALGIECWAMVDEHPQWRYSDAAGEHAMWFYESVRCFRQKADDAGRWDRVVQEVGMALTDRVGMTVAAQ